LLLGERPRGLSQWTSGGRLASDLRDYLTSTIGPPGSPEGPVEQWRRLSRPRASR
jgi:hypothetical protein